MPSNYTPVSMLRGDSTVIDQTPIVDGQILFDESRKCVYMDDGNVRNKYSGLGADSNVATVEDTTTSTHTYVKGDYVVVEGQLYKVTAAIAIGDTFTVGTNIAVTTVGTELTQINSDLAVVDISNSITPDVTVSQVIDKTFYRIGRLVVGSFIVEINTELSNGSAIFGGMPTPAAGAYERIQLVSSYNGDCFPIVFKIAYNYMGAFYPKAGTTGNSAQIMGTVCYITAD